jgi:hypothetical protein
MNPRLKGPARDYVALRVSALVKDLVDEDRDQARVTATAFCPYAGEKL